jgi:hypothetical protein
MSRPPKLKVVRSGNVEEHTRAREADGRLNCLGVVDAFALDAPLGNKASLVL